jgi:hypothetical protein
MLATVTHDEHRALELIAAESDGCREHLLVALGFSLEFLAGLVRSGLAGVTAERAGSGPTVDIAFRLWVTKRGMQALQAPSRADDNAKIDPS